MGRISLGQRAVDRAGVQARLQLEDAGAGDLVAVQHGVLHRRRAAPGGQQREVQVDPAVLGDLQRGRRHQRAVRDHRHAVRARARAAGPGTPARAAAAGVSTSMPRSSAQAPTGERTRRRPRPGGRVRAGSPRRPARARTRRWRPGRAGRRPGVPAKTRRIRSPPQAEDAAAVRADLDHRRRAGVVPLGLRGSAFIASLRAAASSRSRNSTPSRWSVSCCTQRAIRPVPTSCTGSPYSLKPLATTFCRRLVSK